MTKRGEDNKASQETGNDIGGAGRDGIDLTVVGEFRVARVGCEYADARSEREKYLNGRVLFQSTKKTNN